MKKIYLFLAFFIGFCLFCFGHNFSLAAEEVTGGCHDSLLIYNSPLPGRMYTLGDVINFSGKIKTTGPSGSSFFNKITFYITKDDDVNIKDCCGDRNDECAVLSSCKCKEGYLNYYGASSTFYGFPILERIIRWSDEVKFLDEKQEGVYKIGTIYPSDTDNRDPWVAYEQSFIIPRNLDIVGPVRFYVQYSGTNWMENWQWNISYQKGWISDNEPPYAESLDFDQAPEYCGFSSGQGKVSFKWTYQDADKDNQGDYHFQIATGPSFNKEKLVIDSQSSNFEGRNFGSVNTSPLLKITYQPNPENFEIGYNQEYWWRVRVEDEFGNWSKWRNGASFSTPVHAYPWIEFRLNPAFPIVDEPVSFIDNSICYNPDGSSYKCSDSDKVKYQWDFSYDSSKGFVSDTGVKENVSYTYSKTGQYAVILFVSDDSGKCSVSKNIKVSEEEDVPPIWTPVSSSDWFNNLLSIAANLFSR